MDLIPEAVNVRERRRELVLLVTVWLLLAGTIGLLAKQNLSVPGLYYDEAVFAGMAKDFLTGHEHGRHMPNYQVIQVFGRPFPLFVQPYLGALKSWMFLPSFALFGTTVPVLRATTVCWALIALLLFMFTTWRWLGIGKALIAGAILATDPNYFFLAVMDWGSAVPSFICRFASLWLFVQWCQKRRANRLFFAAFFAGLGFFNKVDFAVILVGSIAAISLCYREEVKNLLRGRVALIAVGLLGFVLGAGPILFNVFGLLGYGFSGQASTGPGEFGQKLHTMISIYDRSYFYRLMEVGGMFKQMFSVPMDAPSIVGAVFIIASIASLLLVMRNASKEEAKTAAVLLLATIFITIGVLVFPGAVRIHHAVLVFPLPQLLVSVAIASLWNVKSTRRWIRRATRTVALTLFAALLANNLSIILKTEKLIGQTGGRGLWSDSLNAFCREYAHRSDLTIISLDWGFNEQLAFLTHGPKLAEAAWKLGGDIPRGTPLVRNPNSIYLLHPPEYAVAPESVPYLSVIEDTQQNVEIQPYFDREGAIAFLSIHFPPQ